VDGQREPAARAKNRAEQIRAGPQVRDAAQEFQRVAFLLKRIGGVRRADEFNLRGAQFPFLSLGGRRHEFAFDHCGRAGGEVGDLIVAGRAGVHDDL